MNIQLVLKLLSHPITGGLGVLIGIIGFIYAIESNKSKKPSWTIKTSRIIMKNGIKYPKLKIEYDNNKFDSLSLSRIMFWNDGKKAIEENDISQENPLRVVAVNEGIDILECTILKYNGEKVSLEPSSSLHLIKFKFLNFYKGCVIEVLHTGTSSKDIAIMGEIKDGSTIKRSLNIFDNHIHKYFWGRWLEKRLAINTVAKINFVIQKIISIFILLTSVYFFVMGIVLINLSRDKFGIFIFILCIIMFIFSASLFFINWKRKIPKGLEIFEEELSN